MSQFDPDAFLDQPQTEANEKRDPLPENNPDDPDGLFVAQIGDKIAAKSGEKDGRPWMSMLIPLQIQVPVSLQASIGSPTVTITDRAFLDMTESGSIDNSKGKNRAQRAYRDATDTNKPGEPFTWRSLAGRFVKVKVKHRLYNGAIQEEIAGVFTNK